MTSSPAVPPATWAPDACTLPTAEQPVRVAEFDRLFADSRAVHRVSPTVARLTLDPGAADRARELAARESECCSFFRFDLDIPVGTGARQRCGVTLRVTVPPAHVAVLDAWTARAERLSRREQGRR